MNVQDMIEVTGCDLRVLVKTAYRLSIPVGLGLLHFKEGGLDAVATDKIVAGSYHNMVLSMDYVQGRSVKMSVYRHNLPGESERWFIRKTWYDHSDEQLQELLRAIGKEETHHERTV